MSLNPIDLKRLRGLLMKQDKVTAKEAGRYISRLSFAKQKALLDRLSSPPAPARNFHYAMPPEHEPILRPGKKVGYHFMIPGAQLDALKALSDRDDVAVSELIRQSIREFLKRQK